MQEPWRNMLYIAERSLDLEEKYAVSLKLLCWRLTDGCSRITKILIMI